MNLNNRLQRLEAGHRVIVVDWNDPSYEADIVALEALIDPDEKQQAVGRLIDKMEGDAGAVGHGEIIIWTGIFEGGYRATTYHDIDQHIIRHYSTPADSTWQEALLTEPTSRLEGLKAITEEYERRLAERNQPIRIIKAENYDPNDPNMPPAIAVIAMDIDEL